MDILIKFIYNDREYQVRYDNEPRYGYVNDKGVFVNIDDDIELDLVKGIFMKILPGRKIIDIGKVRYKNKEYQMYIDNDNGYRLFAPKDRDVIDLYLLYNNDRDILYKDGKHISDGYIKRLVSVKRKVIAVSVSVSILLYSGLMISNMEYTKDIRNDIVIGINDNISDEEIFDKVSNALYGNDNLSEEEKEFILDSIKIIINDKKYYDWKYIYQVLGDIRIEYIKKYNQDMDLGSYNPSKRRIICYGAKSFDDANKGTLRHEIRHAMTEFKDNYNSFLVEVFTTIYNKDYYGEDSGYSQIIPYGRALLEIIGSDIGKKYLGYTDTDMVEKELMKVIDETDKAVKLLNSLDVYKDMVLEGEEYYRDNKEFICELEDEIYKLFGEYYEAKYERSMDNDLIMQYYLNRSMFDILIANNYYLPKDNERGEITVVHDKNYFNNDDDVGLVVNYYVFEYREEKVGNNIVYRYVRDRYHDNIVIDEGNRYIYNRGYGRI